ncbi:GNAT family N-acetyltransferase [Paracoccus sp. (in: a-proteobacteria)]|uniref:GNAT family N-acetyltransferase n=1 Tax=Paracoccus sp. TaxID=267 RepID=UPI00396D007F
MDPIPDGALEAAAGLWRAHFGICGWPARIRARHGMVAISGGAVLGVIGLRDTEGGFPLRDLAAPRWLFRCAPETSDLVIDGLAVSRPRQGIATALVTSALGRAARQAHPGLRAEVRAQNPQALAFYRSLGFVEEGCGCYGLPWWGQIHILRRDAA